KGPLPHVAAYCVTPGPPSCFADLLSRSASSLLHRHTVRSDIRPVLAAERHSLLRTDVRATTPVVALCRCRVSCACDCRVWRGHAGAADARCVWYQLRGRAAECLCSAAARWRASMVRQFQECIN